MFGNIFEVLNISGLELLFLSYVLKNSDKIWNHFRHFELIFGSVCNQFCSGSRITAHNMYMPWANPCLRGGNLTELMVCMFATMKAIFVLSW